MSVIGAPTNLFDGLPQTREDLLKFCAGHTDENMEREKEIHRIFMEKMRKDSENLVESLKTSTAKSLYVMAQSRSQSPEEIIPDHVLLRTFLHHVSADRVPKTVRPAAENDPSERAWASFIGLATKFVKDFPKNPDFRFWIVTAWPGIFQWCSYFYKQRIAPEKDFAVARDNIETICDILVDFSLDKAIFALMESTPGIITLFTQLWMHHAAPPPVTSHLLRVLLPTCTLENLDEVVDVSLEKPDAIAKIAVDRLRTTMNQSPMRPVHVSELTFLLLSLARLPGHRLTFCILEENAVWVVTRMLILVSQIIGSSMKPDPGYLECLNAGLTFLRFALVREESPRWVAQALDAGLLRVIAEQSLLLDVEMHQHGKDCTRHILQDTLPKHLVYLSVVIIMDREQGEMDAKVVESRLMKSWLRADWESLMYVLSLRSSIGKLPKEARGSARIACESCNRFGTKRDLLRCSGCMYVYYCSRDCQKKSWPEHRAMCKIKKDQHSKKKEARLMFSRRDTQFIRELCGADAHVHLPHLKKLAKRKFPSVKGEHFAICVDYTNPAYPAGTCSLKNIHTYEFPPLTGDELDPENVTAMNDEMINIVRRNPSQSTFIEAVFAYGEQRLTRNVVMRPNIWASPGVPSLGMLERKTCENQDPEADATSFMERFLGMSLGGN